MGVPDDPNSVAEEVDRIQRRDDRRDGLKETIAADQEREHGRSTHGHAATAEHIPRMKPHTLTVETAETWVLNFYAPAGNELNVMGLARPAEERRRPSMEEGPLPAGTDYIQITAQLYGSHPVAALPFGAKPSDALIDTPADAWAVGDTHVASAADAPMFEAFGARWRVLADSRDTELDYDLLDALVPERAGTPRRVLGADEAIYVRAGIVSVEIDETSTEIGVGSFAYTPAGSRCSWHAQTGGAHVLVFHIPGGFDRALANGRGEDALVQAWDEARRNPVSAATSVPHARSPAPTRGQSRHRVNPDEQAPWSPTC